MLILGLGIFSIAMRFDLSDPERVTRRTDIAFWLHLLAAPLIVHPLVSGMLGDARLPDAATAGAILAIFAALGAVAVLVDRRALLVSGLSYAGIAFATLLRADGRRLRNNRAGNDVGARCVRSPAQRRLAAAARHDPEPPAARARGALPSSTALQNT